MNINNNNDMTGGLPDMNIPSDTPPSTPTQEIVSAPEPVETQKFIVGTKIFDSAEEALAYANGLAQIQNPQTPEVQEQQPVQTSPKVKLGQLLFENPEEALQQVQDQALERFRAEQRSVDENKTFWQNFYSKHPDLKGSELLVDAVLVREQTGGGLSQMTREQAAPILAAKTRQEISKIRNVPSGGTALQSQPAMVAGASGAPTPRPMTPQPAKTDFISELRGMRKRG